MDFLVEFEINVPEGTPETEVRAREDAESAAAAKLVDQGHLVRLWKRRVASGESRPIGLYRARSEDELDGLLRALPLYEFEPEAEDILNDLLPRNLAVQIFRALLENAASFYGAQMSAMDNATRNAGDMIRRQTLFYNRTRQAMITKELIEIISGAEAL